LSYLPNQIGSGSQKIPKPQKPICYTTYLLYKSGLKLKKLIKKIKILRSRFSDLHFGVRVRVRVRARARVRVRFWV